MAGSTRAQLRLQTLTERTVPSVTVVQEGTTLTVTGSQSANVIEFQDDGTAAGLTVVVDGTTYPVDGAVETVRVFARGGGDTVSYDLTGNYIGTTRVVELDLGNGNDTFTGDLGFGIDAASDLTLRAAGGNGKDDLSVTGAGALAGALTVELDGGNGKDALDVSYEGVVTGTLDVTADGGNGVDTITGDVAAGAGSTGAVTALVLGGNGKDDLDLSVTGDELTNVDATIDGGHGKDSITATDNVTVLDSDKKK